MSRKSKKTNPTPASTEPKEITVEEFFKVNHPINPVIDKELNRVWGYVKLKDDREKKLEDKISELSDQVKAFKEKYASEDENREKKSETKAEQKAEAKDLKVIVEQFSKDVFSSDVFMTRLAAEINHQIRINSKFKIVTSGNELKAARFEFGYAKKGNIVFFEKAFQNVLWHLPEQIALVTNTGFVALKDSFWLVIGEDSEE